MIPRQKTTTQSSDLDTSLRRAQRTGAALALAAGKASMHDSKERLRAITDLADSILLVDRDVIIRYASPNIRRLLGKSVRQFVRRCLFELVHPEDRLPARCLIDNLLQEPEKTRTTELRLLHCDGSWRDIEVIGKNLLADPAIGGIVLNSREITERKKAGDELRLQAAILAQISDAVIAIDNEQRITYLNRSAEQRYELGADEAMGRPLSELYSWSWLRAADETAAHAALAEHGRWQGENIHVTRSGRKIPVESTVAVLRDKRGDRAGLLATIRDITARKQAEADLQELNATLERRVAERTAALQQSEERFRQMAENVQDVFWLAHARLTTMLYVSPAFEKIWGRPRRDLYANPQAWLDAVHPEDRPQVHAAFLRKRTTRTALQAEYRIVRPDGSIRWVLDRGWMVKNKEGLMYRTAGIAHDITELKKADLLRTRLQAEVLRVSEMERQQLGRDLHDGLNQQLTAISLLGDALQKELKGSRLPRARATAGKLAAYARKSMGVTRNMARSLFPPSMQISGLPVALKELALQIQEIFPIRCKVRCRKGLRLADTNLERQLYCIAQEAAYNAAKHSQAREISITLRQLKHWLTLTIKDDGIGIQKSRLTNQVLGLNIMKYRASLIGAVLSIEGKRRRGTTVTCKLKKPSA